MLQEEKGLIEGIETVNPNALAKDGEGMARPEVGDAYETMNQSLTKSGQQIEKEIGHILVSMANGSSSI